MSHFGNMLQEFFVDAFRCNMEMRRKLLSEINTAEKALEYAAQVRRKIRSAFTFPAERSPLAPRITGRIELDDVIMEKIIIDSRPGFSVSMNFFMPRQVSEKLPCILFLCGHSPAGKAAPAYHTAARSFAGMGMCSLIIDPIHQGERLQCPPEDDPGLCPYHNRLHRQLLAYGENFASWRTWDAVRAIDYLQTRHEVDPARIGVSGCSGGGTLTALVNACDDRIAAAAPVCYMTRWLSNVENELPVDGEQCLAALAADGGDMADLLLASAPRPQLIIGTGNDFFDVRGTKDIFAEMSRIFRLLGKENDVELFVGAGDHGLSRESRDRLYRFFAEKFSWKYSPEKEFEPLAAEDTFCFPGGRADCCTVLDIIRRDAPAVYGTRKRLSEKELQEKLREMLQIGQVTVPHFRILRPAEVNGKLFSRFALEPEKGIIVTLQYLSGVGVCHLPAAREVELYVPHQSSASEMSIAAGKKMPFFGIDYRGVGENMPTGCDQVIDYHFFSEYHFDYHYASMSWLLGRSMAGMRTFDLLAAIELLKRNGTEKIHLTASGIGVIPALFAAFLSDESVVFESFDEVKGGFLASTIDFAAPVPFSMIPEGILKLTDLEEITEMLKGR